MGTVTYRDYYITIDWYTEEKEEIFKETEKPESGDDKNVKVTSIKEDSTYAKQLYTESQSKKYSCMFSYTVW